MSAARKKPVSKPAEIVRPARAVKPAKVVKSSKAVRASPGRDFTALVNDVRRVHEECAAAVSRTINTTLTLRNWVIGHYIEEYELHGADRAEYGLGVVDALAEALAQHGISRCDRRELYRYRLFCKTYPQIVEAVPLFPSGSEMVRSLTTQSQKTPRTRGSKIVESVTPQSELSGRRLLESLSFTHFAELIEIDDPLKRAFYEIECIRGNWSVRALRRQIATLYFERSALSTDKTKLSRLAHAAAEKVEPRLSIRDPYIFEFLGLRAQDAVSESDLEGALLDNLHAFLMELGHGFCLEARQKSIVIGKTRGFVDLVFYHRILKCHILIELKVDKFTHEHLGQLNTYVTWYRKHMMTEGDNPPVGLLLCTQKDHVLAEYATASVDNRLFVSKYQLELPRKEELERFLQVKRDELTHGQDETP
jgi:predicted nuclease of restriction endonuclease-like (RecB) superfamily